MLIIKGSQLHCLRTRKGHGKITRGKEDFGENVVRWPNHFVLETHTQMPEQFSGRCGTQLSCPGNWASECSLLSCALTNRVRLSACAFISPSDHWVHRAAEHGSRGWHPRAEREDVTWSNIYVTTFSRPVSKGRGPWMHSHFEESSSCLTVGPAGPANSWPIAERSLHRLYITSFIFSITYLERGSSSPALTAACWLNRKG